MSPQKFVTWLRGYMAGQYPDVNRIGHELALVIDEPETPTYIYPMYPIQPVEPTFGPPNTPWWPPLITGAGSGDSNIPCGEGTGDGHKTY